MQKITTFLAFNDRAEEAVNFYTSIFKNSKIISTARYGKAGPEPEGTFMTAIFELEGQTFYALNGGSFFNFSTGISLFVSCDTQQEIDELWEKLSEGGEKSQCGWLMDKFGVWWQIVPPILSKILTDQDAEKTNRVMQAMMKMGKLDIKGLQDAYYGQALPDQ